VCERERKRTHNTTQHPIDKAAGERESEREREGGREGRKERERA